MKQLKMILLTSTVILFTACGGGGSTSDTPTLDNSKLTSTENQYGYFGEEVIFGDTKIVGEWNLTIGAEDTIMSSSISFSSDGVCGYIGSNGFFGGTGEALSIDDLIGSTGFENTINVVLSCPPADYGVSATGDTIINSEGYLVVIIENNGSDCYRVQIVNPAETGGESFDTFDWVPNPDSDIVMCKITI